MKISTHGQPTVPGTVRQRFSWRWLLLGGGGALLILLTQLSPRPPDTHATAPHQSRDGSDASTTGRPAEARPTAGYPGRGASPSPLSAEEIVADKVSRFAHNRREVMTAMAGHFKVEASGDVQRFFDAAESGNWEEVDALFKVLSESRKSENRSHDLDRLWPAILDTYGAAEQAHLWPAQQLLDYGQAVLGSLRPGMVYVGGTDSGRWIPELVNDTSEGEHHIIVTQNALADATYLQYVQFLYGDRLATLTTDDSQKAFQEYMTDAQERFQHDEQFPDEPKQVRSGETIKIEDGRVQVSGQVAVMAINERLLQSLLQRNPEVAFALQESFPMKATYAEAAPLGPIMELRATEKAFTTDQVSQALDYWRSTTDKLVADPENGETSETRLAYAKLATAQANLFATHDFPAEAEQAYRLAAAIVPSNPEPVFGLAQLLDRDGRADAARALLEEFTRKNPDQGAAAQAAAAAWRVQFSAKAQRPR